MAGLEACIDGLPDVRGIAQPGSAAVLGTAGRWFESSCPDQSFRPDRVDQCVRLRGVLLAHRCRRVSATRHTTNPQRLLAARCDFCACFQAHDAAPGRKFRPDSSNLPASPQTYRYWGFQRPISKRTPPSDNIPLVRRYVFQSSIRSAPAIGERHDRPDDLVVVVSPELRSSGLIGGQLEQRERRCACEHRMQALKIPLTKIPVAQSHIDQPRRIAPCKKKSLQSKIVVRFKTARASQIANAL